MIYEPREDSYLLEGNIKEHSKGRVLDMGTGTAILAAEAANYADEVVAADINPEAINKGREKYKNIEFVESDLFSNIKGTFNLIIFNPPYLPDDERAPDIALDGGPRGYELIERFLKKAMKYLKQDGKMLLLFSSLSKKEKINKILKQNKYTYKEIDHKKLDFEELYVYLIQ